MLRRPVFAASAAASVRCSSSSSFVSMASSPSSSFSFRLCASATATPGAANAAPSAGTSAAAAPITPPRKKLHVYTTFDKVDGHLHGLTHAMSDIQRDEYIRRKAIQMNPGESMPDAIWLQQHNESALNQHKGNLHRYIPQETQKHWLRAVDAAKLLGIAENQLPGLTKEKVEEKFSVVYGAAVTPGQKDELTAAAEVLLDYCQSPFAADLTRAKKLETLHKMRSELDQESKAFHNSMFEGMIYGATGYVTSAITLFGVAIIGFYTWHRSDHLYAKGKSATFDQMAHHARSVANYDPNMEGTPDYSNRYRNTPTNWDMNQQEGHVEISDPNMRKALVQKDKVDRDELTLLHSMLLNADAIESKAHRIEKRGGAAVGTDYSASDDPDLEEKERLATGPRLLKEMMESRVDAEWWEKAKKFQAMYREGSFYSKW